MSDLSVTRLLTGLARFVQHPLRDRIYGVHLSWAVFLLLAIVHFWWFEFGLERIVVWTFEIYVFVICYAALFFFLCALLFPNRMDEYSGFAEYFHSRQKWSYGLRAALFLADLIDTAIKGAAHFSAFGAGYPIRQGRPRRPIAARDVRGRPALSPRLRGGRDRRRGLLDREPSSRCWNRHAT